MSNDDQYDDPFDDLDDSDAYVRNTHGYVGDAEGLLRRAIDIIATAPTMPLSSSPRIDRSAYAGTTLLGKLGVESAREKELHGTNGFREVLVNAQGRSVQKAGGFAPCLNGPPRK